MRWFVKSKILETQVADFGGYRSQSTAGSSVH
jgi:hypothetical protein